MFEAGFTCILSKSLMNTRTKNEFTHQCGLVFFVKKAGLEGRAVQSNSPVDSCDRERPSRRSGGASQVPSLAQKNKTDTVREALHKEVASLRLLWTVGMIEFYDIGMI